jgi:hypothetical protein
MGSGKRARAAAERAASADQGATAETDPRTHPEELRVTVEIDIARKVTLRATARATPAGLVSVALVLAAVMVPLALASRGRAPRRHRY